MAGPKLTQFQKKLQIAQRVGFDSMIFLYHFADHPDYAPLTEIIFRLLEEDKLQAVTSTITVAEIFVHAERRGSQIIINEYEKFLQNMPNLKILPVDRGLARLASKLCAEYTSIRLPDALQICSALIKNYQFFLTNDIRLKQITQLKPIILDDYI